MKKEYICSALIGGAFFAIPYLALGVGAIPSAIIGSIAFGAGSLIFKDDKNIQNNLQVDNLYDIVERAKEDIVKLRDVKSKLQNGTLVKNIEEICSISEKIIDTLNKKPEKLKQLHNFLTYYLPVTIKILYRYDEVENQGLSTESSKKFMNSIEKMIEKIKVAFEQQLSNMYKSDMIDTDAEIKVFESMLKADGFLDELEIDVNKDVNTKGEK